MTDLPKRALAANALQLSGKAAEGDKIKDDAPPLYRRVLVVFGGRTSVWWLRGLRPGFRHCFAALDDGAWWLTVDPLLHRLEVRSTGLASSFDLAGEYRRANLVVLELTPAAVPLRCAPPGIFSCVETVKRLLGLRAGRVFTPWQLYRLLANRAATGSAETPAGDDKNKMRKYT